MAFSPAEMCGAFVSRELYISVDRNPLSPAADMKPALVSFCIVIGNHGRIVSNFNNQQTESHDIGPTNDDLGSRWSTLNSQGTRIFAQPGQLKVIV